MFRKAFAVLSSLLLIGAASAQKYGNHTTTINAGIVILSDSGITSVSAAPFALYNLDAALSLKPAGWTFTNPHAPGVVTAAENARWQSIGSADGVPPVNDVVSKRTAAYWEVFLDEISDADLASYNFLLVNPSGAARLTPLERERLRRFVDGGGVLWIDPSALNTGITGIDQTNNFPTPFVLQSSGTSSLTSLQADYSQPILKSPYPLTASDLGLLEGGYQGYLMPPALSTENASAINNYFGSSVADFYSMQPFSIEGNGIYTGTVTRIGDGFVVITSRGASLKLNRPNNLALGGNVGYYAVESQSGPSLGPDGIAAAKLAINMVALGSEARQSGGGSHKANSISADLNAPLLSRFNLEGSYPSSVGPATFPLSSQPVFYKGLMYMTSGNTLYAYDTHPSNDLDGDGDSDDGVIDYSIGTPYDLVWSAQISGASTLSPPVCTEVPNTANPSVPLNQVWVLDNHGNLSGFDALPLDTSGPRQGFLSRTTTASPFATITPPDGAASFSDPTNIPSPTVHENLIYVADNQPNPSSSGSFAGRIWIANARTGTVLTTANPSVTGATGSWWAGGKNASSGYLREFAGSPIVGYAPIQDNSGGSDKYIYVATKAGIVSGQPFNCGIISLWLGARGESPLDVTVNSDLEITTRAQTASAPLYIDSATPGDARTVTDPRSVKLTVLENGVPWSATKMAQAFSSSPSLLSTGVLSFTFASGTWQSYVKAAVANNTMSFRVDYTLDWGENGSTNDITQFVKLIDIQFPDIPNQPTRQIIGNIAMSPAGTVYAVVADPNGTAVNSSQAPIGIPGGSFYALRQNGRTTMNIVTRYDLFPKHNLGINQSVATYPEVLFDKDPINSIVEYGQSWTSSADRRMYHFVFSSGPSVRNGEVFVTAQAWKTLHLSGSGPIGIPNVPVTILMAFNAEPVPQEVAVGALPPGSTFSQPDFASSNYNDLTNPDASVIFNYNGTSNNGGDQSINYDANTGYVQFYSLTSQASNGLVPALSLSQPLIIKRPLMPDVLIDPTPTTGRWSPLLWYQIFQGASQSSKASPFISGNSVFTGMASYLPSILNGGTFAKTGMIASTAATIPSTDTTWLHADDPYSIPTTAGDYRSWQTQLWTIQPGFTSPNPYILWPQSIGIASISDYVARLNQTLLGENTTVASTVVNGLSGGNGTLAALGDRGIYTFDQADFLVCDEGRLSRFDPSGNPIQIAQGAINSGPANLSGAGILKTLVRPTKAYDLDGNTSIVVDSGSNRIIKFDGAGNEIRSIDHFKFDPNYGNPQNNSAYTGIVPTEGGFKAETTKLKSPQDVYTFTEFRNLGSTQQVTGQNACEYWIHYVIADTGNNRLLELVDRYVADQATHQIKSVVTLPETVIQPDGSAVPHQVPQLGVLIWHSPAADSGRGFSYNSISRIHIPALGANADRYVYVAGIGNGSITLNGQPNASPGNNGNGGVVVFDPAAVTYGTVFNGYTQLPDLTSTNFFDFSNNTWDTNTLLNRTNQTEKPVNGSSYVQYPFSNVSSVTSRIVQAGTKTEIAIMVAESDGVFEVLYDPTAAATLPGEGNYLPIQWMLPNLAYRALRQDATTGLPTTTNPAALRATYARRLDNNDVLIVNGFAGTLLSGKAFDGEIIELSGSTYSPNLQNLGFKDASIRFVLGPIQGARQLVLPTFADRR
jgi:hypothetical protein